MVYPKRFYDSKVFLYENTSMFYKSEAIQGFSEIDLGSIESIYLDAIWLYDGAIKSTHREKYNEAYGRDLDESHFQDTISPVFSGTYRTFTCRNETYTISSLRTGEVSLWGGDNQQANIPRPMPRLSGAFVR